MAQTAGRLTMFERMTERAERAGRRKARAVSADLAARMRAELPGDIAAEAADEGVILSGRGIGARFALDPALRWLLARVRR